MMDKQNQQPCLKIVSGPKCIDLTHTHTRTHTHIHIYTHIYIYIYILEFIYTCIFVNAHTYTHVHIHVHTPSELCWKITKSYNVNPGSPDRLLTWRCWDPGQDGGMDWEREREMCVWGSVCMCVCVHLPEYMNAVGCTQTQHHPHIYPHTHAHLCTCVHTPTQPHTHTHTHTMSQQISQPGSIYSIILFWRQSIL